MNKLLSRRAFLRSSVSTASLVALSPFVPGFLLDASARATENKSETILVVIQLTGGNDGLNTVIPYADDVYRKNRPILGISASQVRKINDYVGFHPSLDGFAKLLEESQLAIVQGAGYPQPDRSHFSSMDIWHTARHETAQMNVGHRATGWLGRYLDRAGVGQNRHDVPALHLASGAPRLPLALVGDDTRAGSFQSVESFKLQDGGDKRISDAINKAIAARRDPKLAGNNDLLTFVHDSSVAALESSRQIQDAVGSYKTDVKYPETGLARRLQTIAQLIDAGLATRIFYVDLDGFDTHSTQAPAHAALLAELSGALTAFIHDMKQHGHDKRVMVMSFSEFGRRVHENASSGTDHGTAAPMFLAGGRVKSGLLGQHPSMIDLDQGDLKFTVDFRTVYAGVLEQWLNIPSEPILGPGFKPLAVRA